MEEINTTTFAGPESGKGNVTDSPFLRIPQKHFEFGLLDYDDPRFNFIMFQLVCPILYCLITILGIAGNMLVIYVILSRHNMRTTTNLLLLNLAVADIAFVLICPPFTAYTYALDSWPFGDVLCKMMHYLVNVTAYVTIYTLVLISVTRFLTVVCNKRTVALRTGTNAVLMMAAIWGFMLAINIPILAAYGAQYNFNSRRMECEHYNLDTAKVVVTVFFILGFLIPLAMIASLSAAIMLHIRGNSSSLVTHHRESDRRRKKANRLLISVVVVFALCWLPIHVHIMWAFYGKISTNKTYTGISLFFNPIAYANSCINPFIYNYFSKDFRDSFYQVICFCAKRRRRLVDGPQEMHGMRGSHSRHDNGARGNGRIGDGGGGGDGTMKGVTEVTDLEIKALLPQADNPESQVIDMQAPGEVYIGEIDKEELMERKMSYDRGGH